MGGITSNLVRRASYGPNSPLIGERGARTRQAILDAALQSFQSTGLHGTSVDDIAELAGLSRAALYQYFESKEQLFVELVREAADELLRVIRGLGALGPTAEGYDRLHSWLREWARVQDRYKALYLQWTVVDSPQASLRPLMAEYIESYVSALVPHLVPAADEALDIDGTATVLLPLIFRINDYGNKGMSRRLTPSQMIDGLATFVQLVLFPSTPPKAIHAPAGISRPVKLPGSKRRARTPAADEPSTTVQRILDAGADTFAVRGYHATSVQDVLQAAGAGRGTFYRYFTDKTDLLVSLSQDSLARLEQLAGRFAGAISRDDEGAALRQWLEECLVLHRRYRGVFRALLQEGSRQPVLETMRLESGAAILRTFDGALASVARTLPLDVRIGSLLLLALLERGPDYNFGTKYDLDDERILGVLVALVERGLLGRSPRTGAPCLAG